MKRIFDLFRSGEEDGWCDGDVTRRDRHLGWRPWLRLLPRRLASGNASQQLCTLIFDSHFFCEQNFKKKRESPQGKDGASQSEKADVSLKKKKQHRRPCPFFSSGNKSDSLAGVFAPSAASGAAARLGTLPWVFATCPHFLSPFLWVRDKLLNAFFCHRSKYSSLRPVFGAIKRHSCKSRRAPAWSPGLFWDWRHICSRNQAPYARLSPCFLRILITPKGDVR